MFRRRNEGMMGRKEAKEKAVGRVPTVFCVLSEKAIVGVGDIRHDVCRTVL